MFVFNVIRWFNTMVSYKCGSPDHKNLQITHKPASAYSKIPHRLISWSLEVVGLGVMSVSLWNLITATAALLPSLKITERSDYKSLSRGSEILTDLLVRRVTAFGIEVQAFNRYDVAVYYFVPWMRRVSSCSWISHCLTHSSAYNIPNNVIIHMY